MKKLLYKLNLGLTLLLLVQVYLYVTTDSMEAQTPLFLKRPYYGNNLGLNANFDHHCPDYDATSTCNQSTYLYTYPNPDQSLNGYGRMLKYDGYNNTSCSSGAQSCYSGHSGYDMTLSSYQPVVASAAGTVLYSGWDNVNHEAGLGLRVTIDHGNNHQTWYGHLSSVRYTANTAVGNWQIGTSGTTGNSTGPHLHFEVRYNQNGTWRVKDPYGWTGSGADPWQVATGVVSEWLWLNEPARTQTPPTYNGDYVLDNDDTTNPTNFQIGCNAGTGGTACPYWTFISNSAGLYGDLRYTLPNGTTADYWAKWYAPNLPSTGQYEVEVYIPYYDVANRSHAVRYEIPHQNGTATVVVDQHDIGSGTWISLGRYTFNAGSTAYIQVTDAAYVGNYTDPANNTKKILVDGVRWRKTH